MLIRFCAEHAIAHLPEMVSYPDEGYTEIHLRSDQALIKVRKVLAALAAGQPATAAAATA